MPSFGFSWVYVFPSVWEDHAKLGFSRDPLARIRQFHCRWFEFFDLDRGLLVEAETVRDARAIELRLRRALAEYNAPAPLTVREAAAGKTEWYRGAAGRLEDAARMLETGGHVLHAPLRPWMRKALLACSDQLYAWSHAQLSMAELEGEAGMTATQRLVRDMLDAHGALAIDAEGWVAPEVWRWYLEVAPRLG
jgi:hypothetical protein